MSETEEQNINDMSYQRELEVDMYGEDVVLLLKVNTEVIVLVIYFRIYILAHSKVVVQGNFG